MDKPIDVLVMGLGLVGREAVSAVLGCRGMRLIAAVDSDPAKSGRDLGELIGDVRASGVRVSEDLDRTLSQVDPDIALHVVSTSLQDALVEIGPILARGVDVVSSNEELGNAFASDVQLAAMLDRMATANGATVLGTGFSPGWTSDYLILALTAGCRDVRTIRYRRDADARPYLGSIVGRHFGFGLSSEDFERGVADGQVTGHVAFVQSAHTIAERLGWCIDRIERSLTAAFDETGLVQETTTSVRAVVKGGRSIVLDLVASVAESIEGGDYFSIEATPPVEVVMRPQVSSVITTANAMVNAIPHVMNARPGLMTVGDLPLVHSIEGDARFLRQ